MFDIIALISKQNLGSDFPVNSLSKEYLKSVNYTEQSFSGENFSVTIKSHSEESFCNSLADRIYVFKIGNIFANNDNPERESIGQRALTTTDLISFYRRYGERVGDYIKGIYLLFIFDERDSVYLVFQSKCGLYDLYYYSNERFLLISTSLCELISSGRIPIKLNEVAIMQHMIFDYPLGNKTLFEKIELLSPSTILKYDLINLSLESYFNYFDLLEKRNELNWDETLENVPKVFNDTVDLLTSVTNRVCSAITSGFDSRANMSRLIKQKKEVLFYSWGMPGSLEIGIPQEITRKLGLRYSPVYLDNEFLDNYEFYAKQALFWSDGRATIRRANHNYGHFVLSGFSQEIFTGLIGSEIIRPTNAVGHIFTNDFIKILYSNNQNQEIERVINNPMHKAFIQKDFFEKIKYDLFEDTNTYFSKLGQYGEKHLQLYMFSLNEGFRKYFGHEIHGCRIHGNITTPYIDDDFIRFILRTPIPDLNIYAFKRDPGSLRKGQMVYLPIIKHNCKELLYFRTGRFYKPADLISPLYPISILPGLIRKKMHQMRGNDTFDIETWNDVMFKNEGKILEFENEIFVGLNNIKQNLSRNKSFNQQFDWGMHLAKHFSLRLWLASILYIDY